MELIHTIAYYDLLNWASFQRVILINVNSLIMVCVNNRFFCFGVKNTV